MSELFDAVDALVASRSPLPPPEERKRLRQAHGLTLDEVAGALKVRRATVSGWESGKTEPRPPERDAYARLLKQLAAMYPAPADPAPTATGSTPEITDRAPAPAAEARTVPRDRASEVAATASSGTTAPRPAVGAVAPRPAVATAPSSMSRRPIGKQATPADVPVTATDRFGNGPLLVIDADDDRRVTGYGVGGLVLDVPAKSLPALVEWTLKEAQLGAEKLHASGKDADPLLVLTAAACERYGLPPALSESE
ncbi:helix-turn-helix domain-containing protein, partial [Streptomyces sp. NPDC001215]